MLGYVDEVIILPVAIALVIKMIPAPLMAEFREEAQRRAERPTSRGRGASDHRDLDCSHPPDALGFVAVGRSIKALIG